MPDVQDISAHILDNKNRDSVRCKYCNSLMLKEQQGDYVKSEFDLPLMHQKHSADPNTIEKEPQEHFWQVADMFTFENIGFSNTIANRKFLICADCDMGPVGYHDLDNKQCYIALKRVHHGDEPLKQLDA